MAFINYYDEHALYIMNDVLYTGLGFGGALDNFPFSYQSGKDGGSIEFTELDKFLIALLYQPEFKNEMALSEVEAAFDIAYPQALKIYFEDK
jgi:hypothetical protein